MCCLKKSLYLLFTSVDCANNFFKTRALKLREGDQRHFIIYSFDFYFDFQKVKTESDPSTYLNLNGTSLFGLNFGLKKDKNHTLILKAFRDLLR